ncbi:glycosyltransferase family 2 protein [Lentilitoribacter sp. EG35]|uniref:glycosyltransferase family 2 protein n=1 Tax=Lentilitoribacter sp. EG35 TaxID=3234192 RepID=UPI00345F1ABF
MIQTPHLSSPPAAKKASTPLITVITVVYNGGDFLEATIQSVLSQTHANLEYIIIDGGSSDNTVDIIRRYESNLNFWCSEPDKGIYDAMNKGLSLANGKWVNFMNAGDTFYKDSTISDLFSEDHSNSTIVYGGVAIQYPEFIKLQHAGEPRDLWKGMRFSHQSTFINLKYHKINPYNIENTITADLELFYKSYLNGIVFLKTDQILSSVITGGLAEKNRLKSINGAYNTVRKYNASFYVHVYYCLQIVSSVFKSAVKMVLPKSIIRVIISSKS